MKEFLLLIRTEGDVWTSLSPKQLQEHIEKGTSYIGNLTFLSLGHKLSISHKFLL